MAQMKQSPLFPLSPGQRENLTRTLTALVVRYKTVEHNKKEIMRSMTDQLKALRKLMDQHAETLYETDEGAAKIDVNALIEELMAEDEDG